MSDQPFNVPRPDYNRKRVEAALRVLKMHKGDTGKQDPVEVLVQRANAANKKIHKLAHDIWVADPNHNRLALRQFIIEAFLDEFCKWDKDEVLFLLCLSYAQFIAEDF